LVAGVSWISNAKSTGTSPSSPQTLPSLGASILTPLALGVPVLFVYDSNTARWIEELLGLVLFSVPCYCYLDWPSAGDFCACHFCTIHSKKQHWRRLGFWSSFAEAVGVLAPKIFHRFHKLFSVELKVVSTQGGLAPYLLIVKLCSCTTAS